MSEEKVRYTVEFHGTAGSWCVHDAQKVCPTGLGGNDTSLGPMEIRAQLNDKDAAIAALTAERDALKDLCVKASRVLVDVMTMRRPTKPEPGELFNEINRTLLEMENGNN